MQPVFRNDNKENDNKENDDKENDDKENNLQFTGEGDKICCYDRQDWSADVSSKTGVPLVLKKKEYKTVLSNIREC